MCLFSFDILLAVSLVEQNCFVAVFVQFVLAWFFVLGFEMFAGCASFQTVPDFLLLIVTISDCL